MKSRLGATAREVLENMLSAHDEEYGIIGSLLDSEEEETYKAYYADMPLHTLPEEQRLSRYRRFYRGYLGYMASEMLAWEGEPPIVLDAGSGLGTQSVFFGLMGAKVHGFDLRHDRVTAATKRLPWWEKRFDAKLDVSFECKSLFSLPLEEKYDYIWICQAISHIDPAEDFLKLTYRLLKPGGQVVVTDPNGLFVPNQLVQLRHRGTHIHQTLETHTGETVAYAVERLFTYGGIQRLMRQSGFDIVHGECHFDKFRGKADDKLFDRYIRPLDTMPIVSSVTGRLFVVAGRKPLGTPTARKVVGSTIG